MKSENMVDQIVTNGLDLGYAGNRIETLAEKMEWKIQNVELSDRHLNKLWVGVKLILVKIKEDIDQQNDADSFLKENPTILQTISEIVVMANRTISQLRNIPKVLLEIAIILHCVILPRMNDEKIKEQICEFFEKWWMIGLPLKKKLVTNVLKYFIEASKTSSLYLERLYNLRNALVLLDSNEDILELLQIVRIEEHLNSKEGNALFVYLFTFGKQWIMGLHNNIKVSLTTANKKTVPIYSELYARAWIEGTTKIKQIIAEDCLRDYIFHMLRAQRNANGLEKLGQNLLAFLKHLQDHSDPLIQKLIRDQYSPLLWQHLKAPGTYVRYNAAQLLFSAYPISSSTTAISQWKSNSQAGKGYKAMTVLLCDTNRNLCQIAIKGVSNVIARHWSSIPKHVVDEWLDIMLQLTKTSVHAEVRADVYHGLKLMLSDPKSIETLRHSLPNFAESIYDDNVKVKAALIELLLHINDNVDMHYWNIVPVSDLLSTLEAETNESVVELLMTLLWPRVFASEISLDRTVERISEFASYNSRATRRFFLLSKEMLNHNVAFDLIELILYKIKKYVRNSSPITVLGRRKSSRRKTCFENVPKIADDKIDTSLQNPVVVQTLFDVAAILWTINNGKFIKTKRKQGINKLNLIIADELPNFYNYFKDTPVNESVLFLFSLLPVSFISDSTVFTKICISELYNANVSDDAVLTIVYLFVKWKRVDKLLKTLSECFVIQGNEDILPHLTKRRRLGKSPNGERMFNLVLKIFKYLMDPEFESIVVKNYHQSLIEVWNSLSVIKDFIVKRLSNESDTLSDTTLGSLFSNYVSLIPLLNKTDAFDSALHLENVMLWAEGAILSRIPQMDFIDVDNFSVNLVNIIFDVGNKMVPEFRATPTLCCTIVLFYSKCLATPSGILFVNKALTNMLALMNFTLAVFKNDESKIIGIIIPSLLAAAMVTLTNYSEDVVQKYTGGFKDFPSLFYKMFLIIDRTVTRCVINLAYMTIIVDTIIACINQEVNDMINVTEELDLLNKNLPYVSEKLLKIVTQREKLQELCIDVLEKLLVACEPVTSVSILLIVHKMLTITSKLPINRLRIIASEAKTVTADSSTEMLTDRWLETSRQSIIEAILKLT